MDIELNSLILLDTNNLTSALQKILQQLKAQDRQIDQLLSFQQQQQDKNQEVDRKVYYMEEQCQEIPKIQRSFQHMEEKLKNWSERFLLLEEKLVNTDNKIDDLNKELLYQIDVNRRMVEKQLSNDIQSVQKQINYKFTEATNLIEQNQQIINNQIEMHKFKQDTNIDQLEKNIKNQIKDINQTIYYDKESFPTNHPFLYINDQFIRIQDALKDIFSYDEHIRAQEKQGLGQYNINHQDDREVLLSELSKRLLGTAQQFHDTKVILKKMLDTREPEIQQELKVTQFPKIQTGIRLEERVSQLETEINILRQPKQDMDYKIDIQNLQKQLAILRTQINKIERSVQIDSEPPSPSKLTAQPSNEISFIKMMQSRVSSIIESKLDVLQLEESRQKQETEQQFQEIKNQIQQILDNTEIQENFKQIFEKIEYSLRVEREQGEKIDSLNYIINYQKKTINQLEEQLQQNESLILKIKEGLESKIITLDKDMIQMQDNYDDPCEKINEMKSLQLNIRREVTDLKAQLKKLKEKSKNQITSFIEPQTIQIPQNNDQVAQKILQQHELMLRNLMNKVYQGAPPVIEALTPQHDQIESLESFKQEIKLMINSQTQDARLSKKDLDRLNEINQALNLKIDRDEIQTKVDRADLKKLYQTFKLKIDNIQNLIKEKSNQDSKIYEEAFFQKRKLDADCASCGQALPEAHSHSYSYQWQKFPSRNPNFPGISRILSSLVQEQGGSFTLPSNEISRVIQNRPKVNKKEHSNSTARLTRSHLKLPKV